MTQGTGSDGPNHLVLPSTIIPFAASRLMLKQGWWLSQKAPNQGPSLKGRSVSNSNSSPPTQLLVSSNNGTDVNPH